MIPVCVPELVEATVPVGVVAGEDDMVQLEGLFVAVHVKVVGLPAVTGLGLAAMVTEGGLPLGFVVTGVPPAGVHCIQPTTSLPQAKPEKLPVEVL